MEETKVVTVNWITSIALMFFVGASIFIDVSSDAEVDKLNEERQQYQTRMEKNLKDDQEERESYRIEQIAEIRSLCQGHFKKILEIYGNCACF